MRSTLRRRVGGLLLGGLALLLTTGCNPFGPPAVPNAPTAAPSPTLLPPPRAFSSPEPEAPRASPSPSPAAAAAANPTAVPTRIPPPNLTPGVAPNGSSERATVVNTEGQGANMRAEPSATAALIRTIGEGTELELIGAEREGGGRRWRNVRDPASGASGWIVSELLAPIAPPAAAPATAPSPPPEAKPAAPPKPAGEPRPAASPAAAGQPDTSAGPSQRIGDADRAYLTILQTQIDTLGKAITAANEQIERTGGRPDTVADPGWQQDTRAVADSLQDAAAQIRAATPGPATGEVHRYARNAADRADEAAGGLRSAIDSHDARVLNGVRTTLVRMLAEINNMNLTLLNLQSPP